MANFLVMPEDSELMAAVGAASVRHGQLDHVLRLTVKTILGLSPREALLATDRQTSSELRKRVRLLAKQRAGDGEHLARLDALLARSRHAS